MAAVSTTSPAAAFICVARPRTYLAVGADGVVFTSIDGVGVLGICSMTATFDTVQPPACTAWYSAFLTARATGGTALLHFSSGSPSVGTATSCANFSAWQQRAPYFVLFQ